MSPRFPSWFVVVALIVLGGCATRPINPPITQANPETGYTFQTRQQHFKSQENLVVLAFSGGCTRAAAFSYGVLEFLRRTEVMGPEGNKVRLLDAVSMITGVRRPPPSRSGSRSRSRARKSGVTAGLGASSMSFW